MEKDTENEIINLLKQLREGEFQAGIDALRFNNMIQENKHISEEFTQTMIRNRTWNNKLYVRILCLFNISETE